MKKLLGPNVPAIGRPPGLPQPDAISAAHAGGTPGELKRDLVGLLGESQVLHRISDLVRYASDASPYRYLPQVVVQPRNVYDLQKLFGYCRRSGRHATFRAGGTSLNGQAQSDDILIDVREHWSGMVVEGDGARLRVRPGTILGHAAAALRRHGRRLGPDPASSDVATIGGVLANNAGGMRCTLERNAYHTVASLTFVLPSGTVIDTAAPDAEARFASAEPELASGLTELRNQLLADCELTGRVRHKFSIRNTTGYTLAALLDSDTPLEIFRRLLIGSEGTLAFIAEAVINTLPAPTTATVTWISLPSVNEAVALVPGLVNLGAEAVELMVAPALTAAAQAFPHTPEYWKTLDPESAALLVEFTGNSTADLDQAEARVAELVDGANLLAPLAFTRDQELIELDWRIREGLLGLVSQLRPKGTAVVNEDVCFPPARVAEGASDLHGLLTKHGFLPGVAGHAAYGNLHFTLTPKLADPADRDRYAAFMSDLVELVIDKYDGSLKAEHGTGINMAPFVRHEWGDKATEIMWRIKELADPKGVLAPNVILTEDNDIHLKSFKSTPDIEDVATHCIECGYCEAVCPSRNVTTTPRQRIALRREMARQPGGSALLVQLLAEYQYDGIETCAVDGTCAIPCPVNINTGALIKEFRCTEATEQRERIALRIAELWRTVEELARAAMSAADIIQRTVGSKVLTELTAGVRLAISNDLMPAVPGPMPRAAMGKLPKTQREGAAAVYFPACVNRIFGRDPGMPRHPPLPQALIDVSARAGKQLWIPDDVTGKCCSTPWSSKGYTRGHKWMAATTCDALWAWSGQGTLPVVIDAASCTNGLLDDVKNYLDDERRWRLDQIHLLDSIQWCSDLLPQLTVVRRVNRAAVHPTCSTQHLGLNEALVAIVEQLAEEVLVPIGATCCGTAGDRGLLHPELVVSATRDEKVVLDQCPADAYLSANRTCEMGMRHATGRPYESFIFLLEELTRPSVNQ
ncbi:FAD-binding and (Fe-S)-binding domain-containing protein [Streptomyces sp. NBC_01689]|uniref:FAD-binding and (Fe-S)-binding domain-containing protein n=1 Tax=Streptomyces sp. NBC_01689 TaxID=2975911 RepID=UPI002E334708|nr:FAD-binding and (Fe-S)-binding domain-containing protein [Streptomyces sp. NBC_01689]